MKTMLFTAIVLIALVLWISEWWGSLTGSPMTRTDCHDEDVPVVELPERENGA